MDFVSHTVKTLDITGNRVAWSCVMVERTVAGSVSLPALCHLWLLSVPAARVWRIRTTDHQSLQSIFGSIPYPIGNAPLYLTGRMEKRVSAEPVVKRGKGLRERRSVQRRENGGRYCRQRDRACAPLKIGEEKWTVFVMWEERRRQSMIW